MAAIGGTGPVHVGLESRCSDGISNQFGGKLIDHFNGQNETDNLESAMAKLYISADGNVHAWNLHARATRTWRRVRAKITWKIVRQIDL